MVNPAINAALIAAAAKQQEMTAKHVTTPLKQAGATSPRTAIPLDLSAKGSDKLLPGLVKRGHVRSAANNRYWLDEGAIARSHAAGKRAALIAIVFLLSVTASLLAFVVR